MAHPFTTLSDTIHNALSTSSSEQIDTDSANTTLTALEAETVPEEHNVAQSSESKTTLETIRDVIAHPLTTIGEKIQSVISSNQTGQTTSDAILSSPSASEEVAHSETEVSELKVTVGKKSLSLI